MLGLPGVLGPRDIREGVPVLRIGVLGVSVVEALNSKSIVFVNI